MPVPVEMAPIPPNCPNCGEPLRVIFGSDSFKITLMDGGKWCKEVGSSELVCGYCYEVLKHDEIEDILRAVDLL